MSINSHEVGSYYLTGPMSFIKRNIQEFTKGLYIVKICGVSFVVLDFNY